MKKRNRQKERKKRWKIGRKEGNQPLNVWCPSLQPMNSTHPEKLLTSQRAQEHIKGESLLYDALRKWTPILICLTFPHLLSCPRIPHSTLSPPNTTSESQKRSLYLNENEKLKTLHLQPNQRSQPPSLSCVSGRNNGRPLTSGLLQDDSLTNGYLESLRVNKPPVLKVAVILVFEAYPNT